MEGGGNGTEGREVGQKMKQVKRDLKKNITWDTIFRMRDILAHKLNTR
jgi:uncharacterized protein with HEPN domain